MKTDSVYKRAYNQLIDILDTMEPDEKFPSELALCQQLQVSRTTVRKAISALQDQQAIVGIGRHRLVGRPTTKPQRFPMSETVSLPAQVEAKFMNWMLRDNPDPGTTINELELARQFGVATTSIREFLNRFHRFGLIERRANGGWVFKGFTRTFALELFEIREMFELRSARAFGGLPEASPLWQGLQQLRLRHLEILDSIETRFHDFSELDSAFHMFIHTATPNRFIDGFSDINALIFHYHYQWNKVDERQRNENAIREHLVYIDALLTRNQKLIDLACKAHLASARTTLLASTIN